MQKQPEWLKSAVFYEIYPQSFKDTDADGIGNIDGITEKLPYIADLGCTAIWINPCFDSPFGDAGYDVADYKKVAPRYGTNEDLFRLFAEAHKLGIHVLLDLVPGHTSWKHPWFIESMKAERNEFTDRYVWTDSIWEEAEGYGSLRGISERNGSCAVNFFTHQPALNYGFYKPNRPWQQAMDAEGPLSTREAMKDVIRFWLGNGCDGFRVDMAGSLVKNDEDGKGTIALWQDVRAFLDREFPEAAFVSEWGEPDKSLQGGFHMDFLLHFGPSHYNDLFRCEDPFFRGTGDASEFVAKYLENYERSERKGLICIPSGNHDMIRLAKYLSDEERRLAFAFLLSMPGAPFIYYGDEIGMNYVEDLVSVEGGYERTGSRSPMQWNDDKNAGFSEAPAEKLYIPTDPDPDRPTAEKMMKDPASLRSLIQSLIRIRNEHPALGNLGEISFILDGRKGHPLVYLRSRDGEKILVVLNPTPEKAVIRFEGTPEKELFRLGDEASFSEGTCSVSGRSALFLLLR